MVRAFVLCALVLSVRTTSAQTVRPTIIVTDTEEELVPRAAVDEATSTSPSVAPEHASTSPPSTVDGPKDPHALLRQKLAEMNCLQDEIDALRVSTGTPQSIILKLQVLEVSRTKLEKIGGNFDEFIATNCISDEQIRWLRDHNVAKVKSEPTLAVVCGRPASFSVGGEVPLPAADAEQPVGFQKIGTQIDLLATAQGENRLRLELRARVSDVDEARSQEVAGKRTPAFSIREVDSAVETQIGHMVALAGTTEHRVVATRVGNSNEESRIVEVGEDVELVFLVKTELFVENKNNDPAAYTPPVRTASSATDAKPGERSLKVTRPYSPR